MAISGDISGSRVTWDVSPLPWPAFAEHLVVTGSKILTNSPLVNQTAFSHVRFIIDPSAFPLKTEEVPKFASNTSSHIRCAGAPLKSPHYDYRTTSFRIEYRGAHHLLILVKISAGWSIAPFSFVLMKLKACSLQAHNAAWLL